MKKLDKLLFAESFIGNFNKSNFIYFKENSFTELYNSLICETYNIFPVPKLLVNDMLNFILTHDSLNKKTYNCKDILDKYILDWKYYNEFKENIKLMLEENIDCSITIISFKNKDQLNQIINEFPNKEIEDKIKNLSELPNGITYTYSNEFNVCIAINSSNLDKFYIYKTLQHELIHWMQRSLNSHTEKTFGVFPKLKIKLNSIQKHILYQLGVNYEYVLSEYEFEPWVANTCEEFVLAKLTVDKYEKIIKNNELFIDTISKCESQGMYEMFVFGKVCHITSTKEDDYFYYLIEALKEN